MILSASFEFILLKKFSCFYYTAASRGFFHRFCVPDSEIMRHFASISSPCFYLGSHYPFKSFCYPVTWGPNMKSERSVFKFGLCCGFITLEINSTLGTSVSSCLNYDTW